MTSEDREFPISADRPIPAGDNPASPGADSPAVTDSPARPRRSSLTEEEERSWRSLASPQLERFGHPPMSPPPDDVIYRPPPVSGDTPVERVRDEQ